MPARPPSASRCILLCLLVLALAANACRFGSVGLATPTAAAGRAAASATLPGRTAVLNDLVGTVLSGPAGAGKDTPASNGQVLSEGASVQTGKASKATINLNDGTLLRLRPDTLLTLDRLASDAANPISHLLLTLGKVFVILKSGQLEVQSPAGVAAVTGSFLSVEYQADRNTVVVTCLEGNCTLRNDQSGTALTTGQAASLVGGVGNGPVLRWMTPAEVQDWLADNPEAQAVASAALTALPTVTGTATQTPPSTATFTASPTATAAPSLTPTAPPTVSRTPTWTPSPARRPSPTPSPTASAEQGPPLVYSFDNLCQPGQTGVGTYHVNLVGPQTVKFDLAPGESTKGTLLGGEYIISWQTGNGPAEAIDYSSDQGAFNWTFCGKP